MRQLDELLVKNYPGFIFSTSGAHNWRADRKKGRDWVRWAALRWLDDYAPQIYFVKDIVAFRQRLKFTMETLGEYSATYAGGRVGGKTVPTSHQRD